MRRALAVAVLTGACLVASAPAANAHALVASSDPAAGTQLSAAPREVTIVFTEAPEPSLSSIRVLDASGGSFQAGRAIRVQANPRALRVRLKPLATGVYTVAWRALSRVDGHYTTGAFAFGVGVPVTPDAARPPGVAAPSAPSPSGLEVAGRWLFFVGLIGIIGGSWMTASSAGEVPRATRALAGRAWFLALPGLVLLAEAQRRAADSGIGDLLSTSLGRALLARAAGLLVAGIAIYLAAGSTGRRRRALLWVATLEAADAAYAHVDAGHAAASSPEWAQVLAQWVHVVAVSVWIGGLAALLGLLRATPDQDTARAARRFSTVAGAAIVVVLGTGVVRALGELPTFGDLWGSSYGIVVLVKIGAILVLGVLGAVNRYRNVPRAHMTLDGLRRAARTEVGVGIATVVAAALLASLAPPAPVEARATPAAGVVVQGSDFATTVRVRLTASPGTAGSNAFEVRITDYDSGEPVRASRVSLRFRYLDVPSVGETTLALERDGDVYTASGLSMSLSGRYRVTVLIERATDSQEIALAIATRCVTTAVPGDPTIYTVDLGGGATAQGYVKPVRAGVGEVHVTFFTATGNEQPIPGTLSLRASSGDRSLSLTSRKLSAGHFVADGELAPGDWRFDFSAAASGATLRGCFNETIRR